MLKKIKNWWERRKDQSHVNKKQRSYIAVASLMLDADSPHWNLQDPVAKKMYLDAVKGFRLAKQKYKNKWGKEPKTRYRILDCD